MMSATKPNSILITVLSLGATACLMAGLTWAVGPKLAAPPAPALVPAAVIETPKAGPDKEASSPQAHVRGVVLDDAGRPVGGAKVRAEAFTPSEVRRVTGADGSFVITIMRRRVDGVSLLARSDTGDRIGYFQYGYNLTNEASEAPVRIILKPGREVVVRVTDKSNVPLPEAAVDAAGSGGVFDDATTGRNGSARLHLPADAKVEWIYALRAGQGFDYAEFGVIDEVGRSQAGAPTASLPGSVDLTLNGVRTARIKAVDSSGKPLPGVGFSAWLIRKEGRRSMVNIWSRSLTATTGPDGIATFDWLPPSKELLQFWPVGDSYARRRVMIEDDHPEPVTAKVTRAETIRGRVTFPDGSPAPGIEVHAYGSGQGIDQGFDRTRTAADGTYELTISPGEAYAVSVEASDWAAPSRLGVVVREGKPVEGIDFKLSRGTVLHGKVTVGSNNRPAANQFIRLDEAGEPAPEEFRKKGDTFAHEVRRQFGATTDSTGHYSIRVGPGTYTLMGPPRTENEVITIKNEAEVIRDFRMPRPEKGTLTGRVVLAGVKDRGVAGAKVEVAAANMLAVPFTVTTDADGRFRAERSLDPLVICAKSPDEKLGAIVEVGAEDPQVLIALSPTATATGLLLDEQGKPAANQKLSWGRRVYLNEEESVSMTCFAPKVVTDGDGKFTLPSLVVGQEYGIAVQRENSYPAAGAVRPEKAGLLDLGTLRVGAYHEKPRPEELSSFRKNAPGPGAVAPAIEATTLDGKPLTLDVFRGRYVLLDFWATWCGPCIGEIPQLQSVHDAFGKDGRLAIVSLSVDEKIEEPRKFQEKRKLPWAQAFLGDGIHGPIPGKFGVVAIPAFVLIGPDGKILDRGMRGDDILKSVARALIKTP
jgi:thiol-disulfide isomerase/thioredoxin